MLVCIISQNKNILETFVPSQNPQYSIRRKNRIIRSNNILSRLWIGRPNTERHIMWQLFVG